MRSRRASLLLAVLVAACGGSSTEPAPVTPAPVPEPAELPSGSQPEEPAAAPGPEEARALEAIGRLAGEPPLAYYLPGDGSALVGKSGEAVLVGVDGKSQVVASADDDARRQLAARLAGQQLVELGFVDWPDGQRVLEIAGRKMSVRWQKNGKLSARVGGKTIAIGRVGSAADAPRPVALFSSQDSPAVLVVLRGAASMEFLRFDVK
jgi:hypothetical protein